MQISKNSFTTFYLLLLTGSIYTHHFDVVDKMAIQFFLISVSNLIGIIGLTFYYQKSFFLKSFKHPLILLYSGYLIMSVLSMIKSINIIESFVELGQLFTILITMILLIFLVYERLVKTNHILIILTISLIIDITFSLSGYFPYVYNNIPYPLDDNWRLVGLYGNRNVLATTLAFRIPLVIILAKRLNTNNTYLLSFFLITIAFFNILLLSSRATYLSIIICFCFIVLVAMVKYLKDKHNILSVNKSIIFLYIVPCIVAYYLSINSIDSGTQGKVASRVSTITSSNDDSKNTRLRYYKQSLSHIIKNPLLGTGIGNWKILSIKYDSKNIQNYIIPYNAHNDILEATAETGILGGLFFLSFYLFILYYLFKLLYNNLTIKENYSTTLLLVLPFIVYFVDLNLNFPSARPANLFFLLMFVCLILNHKYELNEKK